MKKAIATCIALMVYGFGYGYSSYPDYDFGEHTYEATELAAALSCEATEAAVVTELPDADVGKVLALAADYCSYSQEEGSTDTVTLSATDCVIAAATDEAIPVAHRNCSII